MVGSQGELSSAQSCGDKGPVFERLFLLVPSLRSPEPVGKCHRRASLAEIITASPWTLLWCFSVYGPFSHVSNISLTTEYEATNTILI